MADDHDDRHHAIAARLLTTLEMDGPGGLAIAASSLRPADLASVIETLEDDRKRSVFVALPADIAAEVLEQLRPELRDQVLQASDDERLLQIIRHADADDAIYFLDHLDDERAQRLLSRLDERLRDQLTEQYELPDESAGRIMSREVVTLRHFLTAAQAIAHIRAAYAKEETPHGALYVVDVDGRLVGVLGFRQLVFAPPGAVVSALMDKDVQSVPLEIDRESVARVMQRYHLPAMPVVDRDHHLRGMVTWDDAVDVLEAEAEEDLLAIAGTAEDPEENQGLLKRSSLRMPWLLITAVGGFVNAWVISTHTSGVLKQALLVGFMPLVPALGGNIGLQCSTVTVRGLATGAIGEGRRGRAIVREISTGMFLAVAMAAICGAGAAVIAVLQNESPTLGVIIAVALMLAVMLAASLGVVIPLACERLRIDPALAAGPFITMLNDVTGLLIYMATVVALLRWFGPAVGTS
ncbi:MAG: magnesium transporter [Planctomycetes bacterium]|nr:magnesium transporter [Planctomycetota bacterium]